MSCSKLIGYKSKSKLQANVGKKDGIYPFFTSSQILSLYTDNPNYDGENIILGTGGSPSVHYYNGKFATSTDNFVIYSKSDKMLTKYLYLALRYEKELLNSAFVGQGLKHLSQPRLEKLEIKYCSKDKQIEVIEECENIDKLKFEEEKN